MITQVNNHKSHYTLVDLIDSSGPFTILRRALDIAGLSVMLSASGPYTLFAPNDRAFAKLPKGTVEHWLRAENRSDLLSVLKYHIFPGLASSADVGTMSHPKMLQGQATFITKEGDRIRIDGSNLIGVDMVSSNGVIHMIDTVMQPWHE
ncbi:fasciclin domain-containing protein [Dyella monticola]|uniref:Fasciclin domain-containing protein n=1 Tax=Dyella monticola TaxID=1927958 RepID=A0A370WU71_9GAMM|nr:fasciclin domain-containing protein [Dyella monticola]RDS79662.1 fasciclin domain-containing protein [Dyella monticola]